MTPRETLQLRVFIFPHVRGTLWLCYVYIPHLMTHSAVYTLPFILQLCYKPLGIQQKVIKGQNSNNGLHKFIALLCLKGSL